MNHVFTNGCFDILHVGHVQLLEFCAMLCHQNGVGKVTVGLNSDVSVRRLKGEGRPHNNQDDRKRMLEALRCVDEVIIFDEDTPYELIKKLRPDVLVKGGDYDPTQIVGADITPQVVIFPLIPGHSSTHAIQDLDRRR